MTRKQTALIILGLFVVLTLNGAWFTIDQTQLGNIRRFGNVVYPKSAPPLGPGVHLKIPFIDTADRIQVTLQTLHIPAFKVLTVDNQAVEIEENFNFTIPPANVFHVMYEVGGAWNVDIKEQVIPVARDRTARVLAGQNMVSVNANRELIQRKIEESITQAAEELFGIQAHSLQIAAISPSESFMESIDAATKAKNEAIRAENQLRTRQFEAQQAAATAKGSADAAIENARGEAESVRLNAEAEKTRLTLTGEGQQFSLIAQIKPFGTVDKYLDYLHAQAALKWDGAQPQIVAGSGSSTNLVVPIPALGNVSRANSNEGKLP